MLDEIFSLNDDVKFYNPISKFKVGWEYQMSDLTLCIINMNFERFEFNFRLVFEFEWTSVSVVVNF